MYVYFVILTERMQTSHYKLHLGEEDIKEEKPACINILHYHK